jgi:putative membrane protein
MVFLNYESLVPIIFEKPSLIIIGIIPIIGMSIFLRQINSSSYKVLRTPALHIFQAFLRAWSSEDPNKLERIIDRWSSREQVNTNIMYLQNDKLNSVIVVPEVHPGPFYPIGSSNLPFRIFSYFSKKSFSPIILHGLSGHELNLPSKEEVENLLKSYNNPNYINEGEKCSEPISYRLGKTLVNGIAFGKSVILFITLSPNGMEDLPREIKNPLESESNNNGFKNLIIVDSHNSQGNQIAQEDSAEIIKAGKKVLQKLRNLEQYPFRIGYSHSSNLKIKFGKDIGPAGISVFVTEVNNHKFTIIAVDSNNAKKNLREELINNLKDSNINVLDICTSDTHITAGKIMSSHGYIALGDITTKDDLVKIIKKLYEKALDNLTYSKYQTAKVETNSKIVGDDMLKRISLSMDKTMKTVKRGGIYMISLFLTVIILSFIL